MHASKTFETIFYFLKTITGRFLCNSRSGCPGPHQLFDHISQQYILHRLVSKYKAHLHLRSLPQNSSDNLKHGCNARAPGYHTQLVDLPCTSSARYGEWQYLCKHSHGLERTIELPKIMHRSNIDTYEHLVHMLGQMETCLPRTSSPSGHLGA